MALKNELGKSRPSDRPYIVVENAEAGWTWKVRKAYQAAGKEVQNLQARWFCEVSSPMTPYGPDLGDVYVVEVLRPGNVVTFVDPDLAADIAVRLARTDGGKDPLEGLW